MASRGRAEPAMMMQHASVAPRRMLRRRNGPAAESLAFLFSLARILFPVNYLRGSLYPTGKSGTRHAYIPGEGIRVLQA